METLEIMVNELFENKETMKEIDYIKNNSSDRKFILEINDKIFDIYSKKDDKLLSLDMKLFNEYKTIYE